MITKEKATKKVNWIELLLLPVIKYTITVRKQGMRESLGQHVLNRRE